MTAGNTLIQQALDAHEKRIREVVSKRTADEDRARAAWEAEKQEAVPFFVATLSGVLFSNPDVISSDELAYFKKEYDLSGCVGLSYGYSAVYQDLKFAITKAGKVFVHVPEKNYWNEHGFVEIRCLSDLGSYLKHWHVEEGDQALMV